MGSFCQEPNKLQAPPLSAEDAFLPPPATEAMNMGETYVCRPPHPPIKTEHFLLLLVAISITLIDLQAGSLHAIAVDQKTLTGSRGSLQLIFLVLCKLESKKYILGLQTVGRGESGTCFILTEISTPNYRPN